jgi:hypothetical protein
VFTGDWAARGVTRIGIDLATAWAEANMGTRPITVVLLNDNGTPEDLEDDWGAYYVSTQIAPTPGGVESMAASLTGALNWSSYDFEIPSRERRLPPGWGWISRNYARTNGSWARLMRDVSHVAFLYGDLTKLDLVFGYQVALDNPRLTTVAPKRSAREPTSAAARPATSPAASAARAAAADTATALRPMARWVSGACRPRTSSCSRTRSGSRGRREADPRARSSSRRAHADPRR